MLGTQYARANAERSTGGRRPDALDELGRWISLSIERGTTYFFASLSRHPAQHACGLHVACLVRTVYLDVVRQVCQACQVASFIPCTARHFAGAMCRPVFPRKPDSEAVAPRPPRPIHICTTRQYPASASHMTGDARWVDAVWLRVPVHAFLEAARGRLTLRSGI